MSFKTYVSGSVIYTDEQAQEIGSYLESLGRHITPKELLLLAKDKSCQLHKYFEWDDKKAAESYRLNQARKMIQAVCVVTKSEEKIRSWHSLSIENKTTFVENDEIAKSESLISQVIERAERELSFWRRRYGAYKEFFHVAKVIDDHLSKTVKGA